MRLRAIFPRSVQSHKKQEFIDLEKAFIWQSVLTFGLKTVLTCIKDTSMQATKSAKKALPIQKSFPQR